MSPSGAGIGLGRRALLLDYGGVLTGPVHASFARFERRLGIPDGRSFELLVAASRTAGGGMIGALERGEMTMEAFDASLRGLLEEAGHPLDPGTGLLAGMFAAVQPAGELWELAATVRGRGVRTGLLSNSWGDGIYPFDRLEQHFDDLVLSGHVGLRKPDPAIYRLAAERLGVEVEACVFVDDLEHNVEAATALGMVGVHHSGDDDATRSAVLSALELGPAGRGSQGHRR
ncbi:MAG: HAD family phosphatase [Nitriliruptoraceae bacterium]